MYIHLSLCIYNVILSPRLELQDKCIQKFQHMWIICKIKWVSSAGIIKTKTCIPYIVVFHFLWLSNNYSISAQCLTKFRFLIICCSHIHNLLCKKVQVHHTRKHNNMIVSYITLWSWSEVYCTCYKHTEWIITV